MHRATTARMLIPLLAGGMLAAALTGCTSGPLPPASNYALIVPVHANGAAIMHEAAAAVLDEILESENFYLAYTSESEPSRIFGDVVSYDQDANVVDAERRRAIDDLAGRIARAEASSAQNDPLEAITLAARELRQRAGDTTIVVLDNLLQTSGALALQNGTLYADPAEVVQKLQAGDHLPDLSGMSVVLAQAGAVPPGSEQPSLNSVALDRLEGLWVAILESAGAEVMVHTLDVGDEAVVTELEMALVPVDPVMPVHAECARGLPDSVVTFVPDSAEFVEERVAMREILGLVAELERSGCRGGITVIGTTSSARTAAERHRTATDRANAVARILARELDVDRSEITTVAAGYDERYCARDRDANGVLVPELAAACRQVIISIGRPEDR